MAIRFFPLGKMLVLAIAFTFLSVFSEFTGGYCNSAAIGTLPQSSKEKLTPEEIDDILSVLGPFEIRRDDKRPGKPVVYLVLGGVDIEEGSFVEVAPYLQETKTLYTMGSRMSPAVVKQIALLPKLEFLSLAYSNITDSDLIPLAKMKSLKRLDLCSTKVTDKGLQPIVQIKGLNALDLTLTDVDGSFLQYCTAPLDELNLGGTKFVDKSAPLLKKIKGLRRLNLGYTEFSDKGMQTIAEMPSLEGIDLELTKITDQGLAGLAGLDKLTQVVVGFTDVTDRGIKMLQARNRKIKVKDLGPLE